MEMLQKVCMFHGSKIARSYPPYFSRSVVLNIRAEKMQEGIRQRQAVNYYLLFDQQHRSSTNWIGKLNRLINSASRESYWKAVPVEKFTSSRIGRCLSRREIGEVE